MNGNCYLKQYYDSNNKYDHSEVISPKSNTYWFWPAKFKEDNRTAMVEEAIRLDKEIT